MPVHSRHSKNNLDFLLYLSDLDFSIMQQSHGLFAITKHLVILYLAYISETFSYW